MIRTPFFVAVILSVSAGIRIYRIRHTPSSVLLSPSTVSLSSVLCLSVSLSLCLSVLRPPSSVSLSLCLSVSLSLCLSVSVSVSVSLSLSLSLSTFTILTLSKLSPLSLSFNLSYSLTCFLSFLLCLSTFLISYSCHSCSIFSCSFFFIGLPNRKKCSLTTNHFWNCIHGVCFHIACQNNHCSLAFIITEPGRGLRNLLLSGSMKYILLICSISMYSVGNLALSFSSFC